MPLITHTTLASLVLVQFTAKGDTMTKIVIVHKDTATHIDVRTWEPKEAFFPEDFHSDDGGFPDITPDHEPLYEERG